MIEKVPTKSLPLTGIDALLSEARNLSQFKDVALLTNKACVTVKGIPTAYALGEILKDNLQCLFSPEHGWSAKGEDGKDVSNEVDSRLNKKVYSLYGALFDENLSRLNDIKTLIIDIQDVGVRCYTFAATCAKVLDYLSTLEKPPAILICDRPNPLGKTVKGPSFNPNRQSLVQYLNVPFQHGQTVGTLLTRYNASLIKPVSLKVIPHKDEFYPFKHRWVAPSPALPNWTSVLLYPGLVLLEGVVLSLGRGTDKPFSSLGAPHLDTTKLLKSLGTIQGISATPLTFTPQSSVFQNKTCQGIEFQITNLKNVQSYDLGLQLIRTLSKIDPDFQWVQNKEKGSYWIDALLGSSDFRLSL
ncbi:MAG: DUF1343 domain-containing protein [Alphaproteobacteria bacterium]|nr:DUF1343 domain-containing protein [Alphaproteobacteria bacterium]